MSIDPTQPIEPFLKNVLSSLDTQLSTVQHQNIQQYSKSFAPQLKESSAIILNGSPIAGRDQFQSKWCQAPSTQHQLTNYDAHFVPGSNTIVIQSNCKLRFDESGLNRLGQSSVVPSLANVSGPKESKKFWGSWYGVCINLIVDDSLNDACINSLNYRITYRPDDSIIEFN